MSRGSVPDRSGAWRAEVRRGALVALLYVGLSLLAIVPGRWGASALTGATAFDRAGALARGMVADGWLLAAPCGLLGALAALARRRSRPIGVALASFWAVTLWVVMVSMSESLTSRGIYPSWVDLHILGSSPEMVRGSAAMFLLPRNVAPTLFVLAPALAALRYFPRSRTEAKPRACLAGALLATALAWLGFSALAAAAGIHRQLDRETPLALFAPGSWAEAWTCATGPCEPRILIERASSSPALARTGAAQLGWPPLPEGAGADLVVTRPLPSVEAARSPSARASALVQRMTELSDALWNDDAGPIHVWQIVLESVRGDDLAAFGTGAPAELAPFLDELYDRAARREGGVLASRRLWGAGVRTPHGVAALLCGLGTLPYGLALPRDLELRHLRCLSDLLADAGFALGFAYGGEPSFDRLGRFLEHHRLASWVSATSLPAATPQGSWGASDRAVFRAALQQADERQSSYAMLLSLSHHHPFVLPEDLPAGLRARVSRAVAATGAPVRSEELRRLITLGYTDEAVRELVAALDRQRGLDRSIVVVSADHAIPERRLWSHAQPGSALSSRALLPFVVWISPRLLAEARDPARAREACSSAQAALEQLALSQNDVPTLLLALLERHPQLRRLAPAAATHSLGGQATSPWYRPPGPDGTAVHGIHAGTALYFVDEAGSETGPEEPATLVVSERAARAITPSLRPAAATLRLLLAARPRDPARAP